MPLASEGVTPLLSVTRCYRVTEQHARLVTRTPMGCGNRAVPTQPYRSPGTDRGQSSKDSHEHGRDPRLKGYRILCASGDVQSVGAPCG